MLLYLYLYLYLFVVVGVEIFRKPRAIGVNTDCILELTFLLVGVIQFDLFSLLGHWLAPIIRIIIRKAMIYDRDIN